MKCTNCGKYTFDEHNLCVKCAESGLGLICTCKRSDLHV